MTLLFCTAGKPGRRGRPPKKKKRDSDEDDDDDDDDDFFNRVETEDVLEDGVEWFEEDKCASGDCKRPKGKRVAWVRSQASILDYKISMFTSYQHKCLCKLSALI